MSHAPAAAGRGLHISFLGMDGIGKTTLSEHVVAELRRRGLTVTPVSWRSCLDADLPAWPQQALRTLWMDSFRLLFAGAADASGPVVLPDRYADWTEQRAEDRLGEVEAAASSPSGPLASAFVEFAGNLVLHAEVIRPALARGEIVVQESFPYKHVLKEYLVTAELAAARPCGPYTPEQVDRLFAPLEEFFGRGGLQPDVGVFLDGPVRLALHWRLLQSGTVGVLEDLRTAGRPGDDGFHTLQTASARRFHTFAQKYGWAVHTVRDAPVEENTRRGLEVVLREIARVRPSLGLGASGSAETSVGGLLH